MPEETIDVMTCSCYGCAVVAQSREGRPDPDRSSEPCDPPDACAETDVDVDVNVDARSNDLTLLSSCDLTGDQGCSDPSCWYCHAPIRPSTLRTLAVNLEVGALLCRAWSQRDEDPTWRPGLALDEVQPPPPARS